MVVLPSTAASHYHNRCIDGGISPENVYVYQLNADWMTKLHSLTSKVRHKTLKPGSPNPSANYLTHQFQHGAASWSSGQIFWLLTMRSRVRFPALTWAFFLEGEDPHGDHGLGSLVELKLRPLLALHTHVTPPSTSSGQCNRASWASQPQRSVTLRPQPGGGTTKSIRDMWWRWRGEKSSRT
jgi:hypothetical protein